MSSEAELFVQVRGIAQNVLQLGAGIEAIDIDTPLLGHLPELDSMAVVTILTSIEEQYGIIIDDDEISADVFLSWRTLVEFVAQEVKIVENRGLL